MGRKKAADSEKKGSDGGATLGFEAKLWLTADKLRNKDAAEYKHVVLGLIFLKYISDSFWKAMPERLAGYGLQMHEEKTRLIEFGRHAHENRRNRGDQGKAETFDFLGFTHYCTRTRTNGKFTIGRKTTAKKMHQKSDD